MGNNIFVIGHCWDKIGILVLFMIIDCISDLHGDFPDLEGGDLLIIAGDITASDKVPQWSEFYEWLEEQPYRRRILIGGNHDGALEKSISSQQHRDLGFEPDTSICEYLCDSGTEFDGMRIWGSPWTYRFNGMNPACAAFTKREITQLMEQWELIPGDIDILVTHTPPLGILDKSHFGRFGCHHLYNRLKDLRQLKLHVFGHIHAGHGIIEVPDFPGVKFANAAQMDEDYKPQNRPIRVII